MERNKKNTVIDAAEPRVKKKQVCDAADVKGGRQL